MASGEHSCTRRALLGAAAMALPLPAMAQGWGAAVAGDPSGLEREAAWRRALARLGRAEAAMRAAQARSSGGGRPFAEQWALDEAFSDRLVLYNRALKALLRRPAPDLAALALKIGLAVDEAVAELSGGDLCLAALQRDVRRLLPPAPYWRHPPPR